MYKKLMFSPKQHENLTKNSIRVPVNPGRSDEQYRLEPLAHEVLPRKTDVVKVLGMMKNPEDWRNLVPFLTGLVSSGRKPQPALYAKIVRLAGESGVPGIALAAAKQVSRTGLTLGNAEIACELFFAARIKAQKAGFTGEEVEAALRVAQEAAFLMHDPKHAALDADQNPQFMSLVSGVLLELSAARALDSFGGKDKTGEVTRYMRTLFVNWEYEGYEIPEHWRQANYKLRDWLVLWHGLKLSLEVEEVKASERLTSRARTALQFLGKLIEKTETKIITESGSEQRTGVIMSKQLYDREFQKKIVRQK